MGGTWDSQSHWIQSPEKRERRKLVTALPLPLIQSWNLDHGWCLLHLVSSHLSSPNLETSSQTVPQTWLLGESRTCPVDKACPSCKPHLMAKGESFLRYNLSLCLVFCPFYSPIKKVKMCYTTKHLLNAWAKFSVAVCCSLHFFFRNGHCVV